MVIVNPMDSGVSGKISIIVVNHNGKRLLKDCLGSLCIQGSEIVLVDNGSHDCSVSFVQTNFPTVELISLPNNGGFAAGNLAGLRVASGDFIALLNNDARGEHLWLQNLVRPMLDDPRIGICAPKVLAIDGTKIDSVGSGLTTAAVGFNRRLGGDVAQFTNPEFVFGACGAAVLYRRKMLDEIGFLDDDFFLYDEDTDLSFRAQLAGWKCVYVPDAVVYHIGNASAGRLSDTHVYYHTRNLEFVWIKNMPVGLMLRYAHHKIIQEIGAFCYLCLRHGKWRPYFRAKRDALRMASAMWRKRKEIHRRKRVPNVYLKGLMTNLFSKDFVWRKIRQFIQG